MMRRRGRAMQAFGIARAPRDPAGRRVRRRQRLRFNRLRGVTSGEAKAADKNGESQVCRLAKLPVKKSEEAGAIKQDGKKRAALELAKTEEAQMEGEDRAPGEIEDDEDRDPFKNEPARLPSAQQKSRGAREKFCTAIRADAEAVAADRRERDHLESLSER